MVDNNMIFFSKEPDVFFIFKVLHKCFFHVLLCSFLLVTYPCQADDNKSQLEAEAEDEVPQEALSLIEIYAWSNTLPKELIDLQNKVDGTINISGLQKTLATLAKEVEKLEWEATIAQSDPYLSYHKLASIDSRLSKVKKRLERIDTPLKSTILSLETWYRQWLEKQELLHRYRMLAQEQLEFNRALPTIESRVKVIDAGKILIMAKIKPALRAGKATAEIQTKVYVLNATVVELLREMNEFALQQTSPSVLSTEFFRQFDSRIQAQCLQALQIFTNYQIKYLRQNVQGVVLCIAFVIFLAFVVHLSKILVKASSRWYPFACKPVFTALFMASSSFAIINTFPVTINLPPGWDSLLLLPMIFAVAMLTDNVCTTPRQSKILTRFTLFLLVNQLITFIGLPQPFIHFVVYSIAFFGFCFYLYSSVHQWRQRSTYKVTWFIWLWGVFPLVIIISAILGYAQFAVFFFEFILSTMVVTLTIWLLLLLLLGLVEMLLLHFPLTIIRHNASIITQLLTPLLALFHGLLWLAILLMSMHLFATVDTALLAITSVQLTLYSLTITPASILTVVFVVYATVLCSRGFRAFLHQEILPRFGIEIGAQVSITRLVHYAILTVGFFILLKLLGVGLGHVAILSGALGVGIGFGLQAIVNNFVSGLILLFERPIKVGDIIEVDKEVGEVRELGLRATTVQTFDNAEIVIPNSALITGNVTNWTLAEKKARVKLPVGVAYGSDITTVLKILLSCAEANPLVLTQPQPRALFLDFGASSLDFELRVWIPDVLERLTVRSELNQDIENEFNLAGITIPFPQTDLHLCSVDQEVADTLRNTVIQGDTQDTIMKETA